MDAFHLVLVVHAAYTYTVKGFGNVLGLLDIIWSVKVSAYDIYRPLSAHQRRLVASQYKCELLRDSATAQEVD